VFTSQNRVVLSPRGPGAELPHSGREEDMVKMHTLYVSTRAWNAEGNASAYEVKAANSL
jgi:hypothetical protein